MSVPLVELTRGDEVESVHRGSVVIAHAGGDILWSIGEGKKIIYPRSACKMMQALPLIESGAAKQLGLGSQQIALACASHNGEEMHVAGVSEWLDRLGLGESDLCCGPQAPALASDRQKLRDENRAAGRLHNNCSGKHAGFLSVAGQIGGGAEYHELAHPVQKAVKSAIEEICDEESSGHGIDGCSAPNFRLSIKGFARGLAHMAQGARLGGVRGEAVERINQAMMAHPLLISGTKRACADFIEASEGKIIAKTGAEGVYSAILPERQIGVAIKIEDGARRAAETAMAAVLVRLGVVDASDRRIAHYLKTPQLNFAGLDTGYIRPSAQLWQEGRGI